jgi:hypothetical protein
VSGGVWITEWGLPWGDPGVPPTCIGNGACDVGGSEQARFLDRLALQDGISRVAWFGSAVDVARGIAQGWYPADWVDLSLVRNGRLTFPFGETYHGYAVTRR